MFVLWEKEKEELPGELSNWEIRISTLANEEVKSDKQQDIERVLLSWLFPEK